LIFEAPNALKSHFTLHPTDGQTDR